MLSPIPPQALTSLRQLADKMEKILLLALANYGNTFVEPKVELGAVIVLQSFPEPYSTLGMGVVVTDNSPQSFTSSVLDPLRGCKVHVALS